MKLPNYRIQQAVRKYKLVEPVKGDSGQIIGIVQQANAWGHTEDIIQRVSDSSLAHVNFQKKMGPLKVEYLWPNAQCQKPEPEIAREPTPTARPKSRHVPPTYLISAQRQPSSDTSPIALQWQIDECVGRITNPELRAFMHQVVAQPEIVEVLRTKANTFANGAIAAPKNAINNRQIGQSHPSMVQCLQSAARSVYVELSKGWGVPTDVKEVLYAATVLEGCKWGLDRHYRAKRISEFKPCSGDEILIAAVLGALHKLDDKNPEQAQLLRGCMGWGCVDEVNAPVDAMRRCIATAIGRSLKSWEV